MGSRLEDKVCVITGTGSGMGRAAAMLFAQEGARVVGCDINAITAEATVDAVRSAGGRMVSLQPCNMSLRDDVDRLMDLAVRSYGRIDVLYNNASMAYFAWLPDMSYEMWSRTIREELDVVFHGCQAVFPHMIKAGGGSIINISSSGGQLGGMLAVHYAVSKAGVISLTRSLARVGAPDGIRVNCVTPGLIETEMSQKEIHSEVGQQKIGREIPLRRAGLASEVAGAVVFLASEEAAYITGQSINVNGGLYMG